MEILRNIKNGDYSQGEVISPYLWTAVVEDLCVILNYAWVYAKDTLMMLLFDDTVKEILQQFLNKVQK